MSPPPGIRPACRRQPSGLVGDNCLVVRNSAAIDAAFCSAERVTWPARRYRGEHVDVLTGGGVEAQPAGSELTFSATTPPSRPALIAICLSGAVSATRRCSHGRLVAEQVELVERGATALARATPRPEQALFDGRFALRTASRCGACAP